MTKNQAVDASAGARPSSIWSAGGTVPIVAIGASAGGLDSIIEFLTAVPQSSGMAFVVIQHLDPQRKCVLPELLQRATAMRVEQISDNMAVEPDCVYVIPPNMSLAFSNGLLTLGPLSSLRGPRYPIDAFFRALATERRQLAAGIVFSGMGSDGTAGLRAIREAGGVTLAQPPESAKFDPMPRSAIDAGVVDITALPGEMPERLGNVWSVSPYVQQARVRGRPHALQELLELLQTHTGNNFSDYKMNTVMRRIDRRMKLQQNSSMEQYVAFLRENPAEVDLLFKELLIGVTSFFRDPKMWEHLKSVTLPAMIAANPEGCAFKAWVPACSTGEEAYSLAIVFDEVLESINPRGKYSLQIFATDLDPDAIDRARQGVFSRNIEESVSADRLCHYFVDDGVGFRIRKDLRNSIIFAQQNVISDPPFTKLDILSCRNLLIYFNHKLQEHLIPLFHYALKRDGFLLLGSADTPGNFTELFVSVPGSGRVYQRLDAAVHRVSHYFPTKVVSANVPLSNEARTVSMTGNLQSQVEHMLLKKHSPAAVLLSKEGDILYIHGRTGTFLEPAAGKANWNIHAMARDGLRYHLAELLEQSVLTGKQEALRGLMLKDSENRALLVDITAEKLADSDAAEGTVLLTFQSMPAPSGKRRRGGSPNPHQVELEQQLAQARMEIHSVRDEMQTSREELKSANEELQSTNEELQSTNEELTTSKEEMQSLNEELYTVNAELQSKVDDLSMANSDMKNLLNSTDIAVIYLDNSLHIRRFTTQATQIYKLIPGDVNRPLGDIVTDLIYPELEDDAREVLRTLAFCEKQIATKDGRWFMVRVRPYRTLANVIDGLVATFVNITELKSLEARLEGPGGNNGETQ
ncbi:chemotaxis protein CheB [Massilia sp. BJB1822]|uniref:chemotaxis protein CheB n=1 Tax=Massilia sp. BJB1822 TaxID=2744470 RepID=UPI001594C44B|nr:chemotaxis protein CheB [Massilia sp. BJB1822]NVE01556.1 PAS domain-containing protein [Massilia sp. BJB1822]